MTSDVAAPPPDPALTPTPRGRPRPRAWFALDALLAGLAVASMLAYWITGLRHDSIEIVTIYRHGDYQYLPLVAGLAEPTLGDPIHWEDHGEGLVSFPLPSLVLHALATRLLGAWGFLVLDVVLVVTVYALASALLRAALLPRPLAALLAFATACASAAPLLAVLDALGLPVSPLWGLRFPRPLVADVFLLLSCLTLLRVVARGAHERAREWALAGAALGLVVQCEPYAAPTVALVHVAGAVHLGLGPFRQDLRRLLRLVCVAAAAFALVCGAYVAQRLGEHPDIPVRLGLFPVPRGEVLSVPAPTSWPPLLITVLTLVVARRLEPQAPERRRVLACLAGLTAASMAAFPLTCLLLGKTIQPYHFGYMHGFFSTLAIYGCVGAGVTWLGRAIVRSDEPLARRVRGPVGLTVMSGVGLWLVGVQLVEATSLRVEAAERTSHHRTDFGYDASRGYRDHFRALVEELRTPRYADARVIGTFDAQVLSWWSLFGGRFAFAPDPFATTAPDAVVEDRLLRLLAVVGADEARLGFLFGARYMNAFFLAHDKYQASRGHTFAPLSDYGPEARARIADSTFFESWKLELPSGELRRLQARYAQLRRATTPLPRLDLIVLLNDARQRELRPDPARFALTYENPVFRVYRPR